MSCERTIAEHARPWLRDQGIGLPGGTDDARTLHPVTRATAFSEHAKVLAIALAASAGGSAPPHSAAAAEVAVDFIQTLGDQALAMRHSNAGACSSAVHRMESKRAVG
jgi:hypothetical protein